MEGVKRIKKKIQKRIKKKGFILTLDLILGTIIVFAVIMVSIFFLTKGSSSTLSEHQFSHLGSDIISVLDAQKVFDSLDHNDIEENLDRILPANYGMLIRIQGDFEFSNGTIEVGGEIPDTKFIISNRRVAFTDNETYLKITYFMWGRDQ